jgi:hypothetical protein
LGDRGQPFGEPSFSAARNYQIIGEVSQREIDIRRQRGQGMKEVLEKHPEIKLLESKTANWSRQ